MTGIPDIEEVETSSRNPLVVRQHVIANEMGDYAKFYFLGGSASWGEIRGLLSTNIKGLRIYEEGSYTAPREDVWGSSDMNLFKEANKVLKTAGPGPSWPSSRHPATTAPTPSRKRCRRWSGKIPEKAGGARARSGSRPVQGDALGAATDLTSRRVGDPRDAIDPGADRHDGL